MATLLPRGHASDGPGADLSPPCHNLQGLAGRSTSAVTYASPAMPAVVISFLDGEIVHAETPPVTFELALLEAEFRWRF